MSHTVFRFRVLLLVLVIVITAGTFGFSLLEGLSLFDALYLTIVTIATVGYGDLHPTTTAAKILAMLLILAGVGTFVAAAANAFEMILSRREKQNRIDKMHMLIGVFFSEAGLVLLRTFSAADPGAAELGEDLKVSDAWSNVEFSRVGSSLQGYSFTIDRDRMSIEAVRRILSSRRDLLLQLLQNPILLEHDAFTDLLHAVFHLTEELDYRSEYEQLPEPDLVHLAGDMQRVYRLLALQWLAYMQHLKKHYPYLFSLAMRTNPFDREASPVVH
ncbi:MAG TPA: two pore domain potassium channel family protein [Methanolinea sp.]|nr:two pore domain potassium channel family protein [Methanolinea sp.]